MAVGQGGGTWEVLGLNTPGPLLLAHVTSEEKTPLVSTLVVLVSVLAGA